MNKKELFKSLNKLCEDLDYDYNINCGGCCFVAACLAEQLEKYCIPFKVAIHYKPTHYWIKVSDRNINRDEYTKEFLELWDSKYLFEIYNTENWNHIYNRKWNLIVRTKINSLFIKYGNSIRRRSSNSGIRR